jgi:hypothetical protein
MALEGEQEMSVEAMLSDYKKAVNINNRTDAVSALQVHRRRRRPGMVGEVNVQATSVPGTGPD